MALKSGISSSTPVPGFSGVDLAHGLGVEPGAAVGQVVAGDAGDGRVLQAHGPHGLGDAARLVLVEVGGLARVDLAEVAAARALVTADEERGLAVLPALEDVGTAGLFADRVQALALDERFHVAVLGTHHRPGLDPVGLLLDGRGRVARFDAQHASAFRCDGHADPSQVSGFAQPKPRAPALVRPSRGRPVAFVTRSRRRPRTASGPVCRTARPPGRAAARGVRSGPPPGGAGPRRQ